MSARINALLRTVGHIGPPTPIVDRAIRSIVEHRDLVSEPTCVASRFGPRFQVFDERPATLANNFDYYLYYFGIWEPHLARVLRSRMSRGMHCIDAGAHHGWYSLFLASMVGPDGRVYAFEPDSRAFAKLEQNVALNDHPSQLQIFQAALGSASGTTTLKTDDDSLNTAVSESGTVIVPATTIDNYRTVGRPVDIIKLDIEGSEWDALRGAEETLYRDRPMLQVEINPRTAHARGWEPRDMLTWLQERYGYQFRRPNRLGWMRPFDPADATTLMDIYAVHLA
jgi:FkbM family methyltransferase